MRLELFIKEKEQIEKKSIEEQKAFYQNWLEMEQKKSAIRILACFSYAKLFYQEGNFRKARDILEPFVIDYQSYAYIPEMISCFNLMGVAAHCETEYYLSRYFYNTALKIARENDAKHYFSYEYNNMALTYIAEEDYIHAKDEILKAEEHLKESDEEMGAYVYLNMAIIDQKLDQLREAQNAFDTCINQYNGRAIIPDDVLLCGVTLFYRLGEMEQYEAYKSEILKKLDAMYAAEFMDACKCIFECGMDSGDEKLVKVIIRSMEQYMMKYPHEIRVGVTVEELKYLFAKKQGNRDGMLEALEQKCIYKDQIISNSERKRAEAYQHFLEINRELQNAIDSREKASSVKSQFLANMSHDMRTPINGIMGMLEMIRKGKNDVSRVDDCLDKIELSSRHLLSLVNDVLDMTKLESESVVLGYESFNLDQICAETMELVAFQAIEAGLSVSEEHDDIRGIQLFGSPLHLKKVLINLFSNCMKYNKAGGAIYTSMHIIERTEDILTCEFQIRDTGVGMSEEFIQHKLFEPFVQGNDAGRSNYAGTGLGMAIVRQIIEKMGGSIVVESEPQIGSCFTVTIPFEIDHESTAREEEKTERMDLSGMHFLVVEDNELNMEIAEFLLTEEGATIDKAQNGLEALEKYEAAEAGTYQVILMDLMMPVMDGYQAAREIRVLDREDARRIPIIAMSANAFPEDVQASLDAGMNAHMEKPFQMDHLFHILKKVPGYSL